MSSHDEHTERVFVAAREMAAAERERWLLGNVGPAPGPVHIEINEQRIDSARRELEQALAALDSTSHRRTGATHVCGHGRPVSERPSLLAGGDFRHGDGRPCFHWEPPQPLDVVDD